MQFNLSMTSESLLHLNSDMEILTSSAIANWRCTVQGQTTVFLASSFGSGLSSYLLDADAEEENAGNTPSSSDSRAATTPLASNSMPKNWASGLGARLRSSAVYW